MKHNKKHIEAISLFDGRLKQVGNVCKPTLHVLSHDLNVHFNLSYLHRGLYSLLSGMFK
jgi:hypothetical protein